MLQLMNTACNQMDRNVQPVGPGGIVGAAAIGVQKKSSLRFKEQPSKDITRIQSNGEISLFALGPCDIVGGLLFEPQ